MPAIFYMHKTPDDADKEETPSQEASKGVLPAPAFDAKTFLKSLPELPGVYRMIGEEGILLYVGKAKNLKKRVSSYFQKNLASPRIAMMVSQISQIEITVTRSEAEALLLENNLIKRLSPRYNILFRDDKSYPYIMMSREPYPRLCFYRGIPDKKADYFGPYPSAQTVRDSIGLLQKIFRLRTCEDSVFSHRSRPCLLHQIQRCTAPCAAGLISPEDYGQDVRHAALFLLGRQNDVLVRLASEMEAASNRLAFEQAAAYRDQIQSLRQVQEKQVIESRRKEDADIVVAVKEAGQLCVNLAMVRGGRHLGDRPVFPSRSGDFDPEEVIAAFISQHYIQHAAPSFLFLFPMPDSHEEIAAALESLVGKAVIVGKARDAVHKAWVEMALQNARLALIARNQARIRQEERLLALQEALGLPRPPFRIECFDISHTGGELPVASCVVYQDNSMKKQDYRRFNIRDIEPGDDYAAIRQAVSRRYAPLAEKTPKETLEEGKVPDLILIDGGKGQTGVAAEALNQLGLSHLPVVGVAKGEGRKAGLESLVFPDGQEALQLGVEHPALQLVLEIRDEAHRFALTGHRARRGKARNASRLEEIPGIGAARRKALIARFGGFSGVLEATKEQLAQTPSISPAMAEAIYNALH